MPSLRSIALTIIVCTNSIFFSNEFKLWLPQESNLRFYNNEAIVLKSEQYKIFLEKWNNILNKFWHKVLKNIENDTSLTLQKLETYLQDETLAMLYTNAHEQKLTIENGYIHEEEIDPVVLNFIKRTVSKYTTKNIKIVLSSNIPSVTATFGTDQSTHYLICNSNLYTTEIIQHYYDALANNKGAFYVDFNKKQIRFIEYSNFLLMGIIEAASHIEHQHNLFTFLLSNFKFANKEVSSKTLHLCWQFTNMRGIIEAILQSKNPLESAYFYIKVHNQSESDKTLWQSFLKDLAQCYSASSLKTFKATVRDIKDLYL